MIGRTTEKAILKDFGKKKIIVLLGPRQVGKTTLLDVLQRNDMHCLRLNCDDMDDAILFEDKTSTELKEIISSYDMVFIDEAQL